MINYIEILSTDIGLVKLAEQLGVHPLALEDCLHRDQRPKLDDYESHQLLVWFVLANNEIYELQFLIFKETLVLVPHDPPPQGNTWAEFLRLTNQHKDVWHALYQALDRSTDISWQELRKLLEKIDQFEQEIFEKEVKPEELLILKRELNNIDYSLGDLSSVAKQFQNLCNPVDDLKWKLRDLYDHCKRITQSIALYRTQIATDIDLFWGLQANRTNKQMKKLTLLASIAVPLTFWASFWGMNFNFIPFHKPELFILAIGIMIVSVALTMWLLVRKGYWND